MLCRGALNIGLTKIIPGLSSVQCYALVAWSKEWPRSFQVCPVSGAMHVWPGDRRSGQDHSRSVLCPMIGRVGLKIEGLTKIIPGMGSVQ